MPAAESQMAGKSPWAAVGYPRALGLPRAIPPGRLLPALRCALIAPDVGRVWRIRGVRLVATDLGFSAGVGPEVRGAAEALLMVIAGRHGVVRELSGPGQRKLAGRIDGRTVQHESTATGLDSGGLVRTS